MTPRPKTLPHAYFLLACLAASPAFAQASASVAAGSLSGDAKAGPVERHDRVARGPRTDDTRDCDTRGVTVQSGNGSSSASASVTTTPSGSAAVAGSGSPSSKTEFFGCDHDRSTR